ncbi:hypothetical protein SPRG_13299 [Saprolegnia parasitica CBS 223.65]|uniref:Uncharacterized protein n=1 Tax=Saprolegnia parasitica (strain CBS 223.65) TaxID=695850 RepID=A0A067BSW9_SAPPC|nr:hypothetical protein SPRG_13299 [Saprolegnia parasitica CBS 223.65]KDO21614.1 hypothetical protein SPRG_13299 [Saprolegnia parasitica CBS 223.65]|eukprot:XP_012207700.1 hypothetical protein SPRG_13299 [Saprolegnia parasitica CBS 223.65]
MVAKRRSVYSTMTKGPMYTGATLRFTRGPYYAPSPDVVADKGMTREDIEARIHRIQCAQRIMWYNGEEKYNFDSQDIDDLALVFGICDATTLEELSAADKTRLDKLVLNVHNMAQSKQRAIWRVHRRFAMLERERDMCEALGLGRKPFCAITEAEKIPLRFLIGSDWKDVKSVADVACSVSEAQKRHQRTLWRIQVRGITKRCTCCRYYKHAPRYTLRRDCRDVTQFDARTHWEDEDMAIDDDVARAWDEEASVLDDEDDDDDLTHEGDAEDDDMEQYDFCAIDVPEEEKASVAHTSTCSTM